MATLQCQIAMCLAVSRSHGKTSCDTAWRRSPQLRPPATPSKAWKCQSASSLLAPCRRPRTLSHAAVDLPPIDGDIMEAMLDSGAEVDDLSGLPLTFGNDEAAIDAAVETASIYNMTHYGRIRISGDDRIRFLHNQTTNDFQSLRPGQGCLTVFQTPTARTIDLAVAWVMKSSVILTVSPSRKGDLLRMMDRYIFPADEVKVTDITDKTCQLALIGPNSSEILEGLGIGGLEGKPFGTNTHFAVDGSPATVGIGTGLGLPGYTIILSADVAGTVWASLETAGALPVGERAYSRLRVLQGVPVPGAELTEEFNTLEAGLWDGVSTTKGCYIGQETIARLITYNGVKQNMWGMQFPSLVEPGTPLMDSNGQKIGKVTSSVQGKDPNTFVALGYIKKLDPPAKEGMPVFAQGVQGALKEVPFVKRASPVIAA